MPKINVYLPDALALLVREAGIAVSAVCQRALAEELRLVDEVRVAIVELRSEKFGEATARLLSNDIWNYSTQKLRSVFDIANVNSPVDSYIDPQDLLIAILDHNENLAVRLLRSWKIDIDELRVTTGLFNREAFANFEKVGSIDETNEMKLLLRMTGETRLVVGNALAASLELGDRFLGCEHVLLGLLTESAGSIATYLKSLGITESDARKAVVAASAGYSHAKDTGINANGSQIDAILDRIEKLESRLTSLAS